MSTPVICRKPIHDPDSDHVGYPSAVPKSEGGGFVELRWRRTWHDFTYVPDGPTP
ncbi:hypothetical protein [Streptomyces sp. NPDC101206]|uniref:hypothetical protein n=1 Tax=Streptomyces sp. NPDC101206 TaxID=3366128 RepID=UPI0037F63BEB